VNSALQFTDTTSSSVSSWNWNFGPYGTAATPTASITYTATGTNTVSLTVTSAQTCSATATHTVTVLELPVPGFTFTPNFGAPPLAVQFTDTSKGGKACNWIFGDGNTSALQNSQNTYQDTGTYSIIMTTCSPFGCMNSDTQKIYVAYPMLDIAVYFVSAYLSNNTVEVTAYLINDGTLDVQNIELSEYLDNGTPVHEFYTGPTITHGKHFSYQFNSSLELTGNQHSIVCVDVKKVNGKADDVSSNNHLCTNIANDFILLDPFPNPTTDEIYFLFVSPDESTVKAEVYDELGNRVEVLFDGTCSKGLNEIPYNTVKLRNGVYMMKLTYKDKSVTKVWMKK
jgi:PKD repeat protein